MPAAEGRFVTTSRAAFDFYFDEADEYADAGAGEFH